MQFQIVQNKGFARSHETKLAKFQENIQQAKGKETMALNKLAQDKEFLEKAKIDNGIKILIPWATKAGCPKCRWKPLGSTCCSPEKMLARIRAVEAWQEKHKSKEDKCEDAVYNAKLLEIYQEIKAKHTAPLALPKVPEKAGGYWKDCK